MKKKCIHLVPHTHWDREWYFTSSKSKIYLVNNMKEILEMLEKHKDYSCYVLDGQTVVLEDYLSSKPQDEARIKKLVKDGRLKIGPWYTQTDEMVVGGESVVRNLLYGKLDCDKFGDRMMIGYLPDSFGQSAAFPKILNGFGIDKSLFWRGYSERLGINQTEFLWASDDGSEVVVQLLPINYSVGIMIPSDVDKMHKQFDEYFKILDEKSTTGDLLVPNGHDQMPVQQNIFEIIDIMRKEFPDYDVKLSSYEELYKNIDKKKLPTIKGELLDGKYQRAHRSIFSSRADLKSSNTRIENKITNVLEPIASVAHSLGFDYQSGTIEQIWRGMLKNHAHDSIGCCCTDNVNRQVQRRFDVAEDTTDNLIEFYLRKLLESVEGDEDKLIVFNPLPYSRKNCYMVDVSTYLNAFELIDGDGNSVEYEVVDRVDSLTRDESENADKNYMSFQISLKDEIPAMGYKIYKIVEGDVKQNLAITADNKSIENEYFKININNNGSLNIYDKKNGRKYNDVLMFEDSADGGDSYDYSPIKEDWVLTSHRAEAEVKTRTGSRFEEALINFRFDIPKNMESRLAKKLDGHVDIKMKIALDMSKLIRLSIEVDNQAEDHRLRLLVPQNLASKKSIADVQFGKLERNVYDEAVEVWEKEKWDEKPDPIYPFLSYVRSSNNEGLGILTNSVREFEFINGSENYDTLAITIYRSFGKQGRRDLLRRPGRASGTSQPTPDSQLLGKNTYELAMTSDLENIAELAKQYVSPIVSYSSDPAEDLLLNKSNIDVPLNYSLLNVDKSVILLSAIKKAEADEGLCLRLYNSSADSQKLKVDSVLKIASELMLDESEKKACSKTVIEFKPFEIKTLKLK